MLDRELDDLMSGLAAIAIEGAKGVGKTRTALERAATTYRLDVEGVLEIAAADPERLIRGVRPILIDEWQRLPETWDLVRRAVDGGAAAGSFLLTGSATPRVAGTHSGAGRIVRLRMRPLSLTERGVEVPTVSLRELLGGSRPALHGTTGVRLDRYVEEICRSGFPGMRGLSPRARRAQLDGYVERIIDRDFADAGRRTHTAQPSSTSTMDQGVRRRDRHHGVL